MYISIVGMFCKQGCGAGAGAAGTDTFWSEPEQPKRLLGAEAGTVKNSGSGSENGYNCGEITEC